jgi:hypothetical protein
MRTKQSILVLALASAALISAPTPLAAPALTPHQLVGQDKPKMVTGTVKEKSEKELVVRAAEGEAESKVTLTKDTKYTKDKKPATLNDVIVGSRVEIKLKGETQEALEVNILPEQK